MAAPAIEDCEPVTWHSKQKHALIEAYLRIWVDHVTGPNAPSLDIVDVFAGRGWCYDEEQPRQAPWEGTSILAARCLGSYRTDRGKRLVVNTWHKDAQQCAKQHETLARCLDAERTSAAEPFDFGVMSDLAPAAIDAAKRVVRRKYPTLWFLDPYGASHLPWACVQSLLDWSHTYVNQKGREHTRRPELFINLMTSGLQRNIDIAPDGFTTALGVPEHEWRPEYDRLRASGMNTLDVVLEMYVARLRPYYSLEPIVVKVDGVKGNIVYVMIFCTQSKEAYFLMQKEGLPAFRVWKDRKWIPRAEFVAATRREDGKAAKAGQRAMKLTDFSDEGSA